VSRVGPSRPTRPDKRLLAFAGLSLQASLGVSDTPVWSVLRREVHPRSTVFLLEAAHGSGRTRAYLKVAHVPVESGGGRESQDRSIKERRSLVFEQQVSDRLEAALYPRGVTFDRPLALDVERLSGVRLAVPGRPIGRAGSHMVAGRRRTGLRLYRLIGEAMRLVEGVTREAGPAIGGDELDQRLTTALARARPGMPRRLHECVSVVARDLQASINPASATVWSHGDLSSSNILTASGRVGLIDFSWRRGLAGESIAYLVSRVSVEPLASTSWKRAISEAVLEGYRGHLTDSWKLAYLLRLLRWAQRSSPIHRSWAEAELRRLAAEVRP